jgi:hypothetical protein
MSDRTTVKEDRSHWKFRKFDSFEAQRRAHVEDWQKETGAARRAAAWELVVDYWVRVEGKHPDELRLQRTVTNFKRAGS